MRTVRRLSTICLATFLAGASIAALAVAALVWLCYASADRIIALLGPARARVLARLAAFLLLCVGVQIALNGVTDFLAAYPAFQTSGS